MENSEDIQPEQQETIFNENDFALHNYDRHIKQARNTLFIIAGVQLILGIFTYVTMPDSLITDITLYVSCFIALIFALLAFWTKRKPHTAIVTALIIYILLWIGDCIVDPTYIFKGIIFKVVIIVYLVRGLSDAKEAQQMRKALGK